MVPCLPSSCCSQITTNNNKKKIQKTFFVALQLTIFPIFGVDNLHEKETEKKFTATYERTNERVFHYSSRKLTCFDSNTLFFFLLLPLFSSLMFCSACFIFFSVGFLLFSFCFSIIVCWLVSLLTCFALPVGKSVGLCGFLFVY